MPLQPPQLQLTEREVDVLHLIGKGYKVPDAAGLSVIGAHTVTSWVRSRSVKRTKVETVVWVELRISRIRLVSPEILFS